MPSGGQLNLLVKFPLGLPKRPYFSNWQSLSVDLQPIWQAEVGGIGLGDALTSIHAIGSVASFIVSDFLGSFSVLALSSFWKTKMK